MAMEVNEATLSGLGQTLAKTMETDNAVRVEAERHLKAAQTQAGFLLLSLKFVQLETAPEQYRVAAAVLLKNAVNRRWFDEDNAASPRHLIADAEREFLRSHMVRAMLEAPTAVQRQLSEALALMAQHDFPEAWPSLLPELVAHISSPDYNKVLGVLNTAHTIFRRYRFASKSDALWAEIKYVLVTFSGALLEAFERVCTDLSSNQDSDVFLNAARLIAHIFLSLSSQDIPEQFEDALPKWMPRFVAILKMKRPAIAADDLQFHREDPHDPPTVLDRLQAVIVRVATIYVDKYEEEFRPYVAEFVGCVWDLLTGLNDLARHDPVVTVSLNFLTSVVAKPWHKDLFSSEERLRGICERIVIPNIRLRASDLELFSVNGLEYVRRDMEGSDANTRRRLTCDLVRALTVHFEAEISAILFGYVDVLLKEHAADPLSNWVSKDAAMFVILALAVQGHTQQQGATRVNKHVNLLDFFQSHVLPELQSADVQALPVLKADAIKFISTFRGLLPVDACTAMLPLLGAFLASDEFVVHTYAAAALEKLLALRDANRQPVLGQERLRPHLGPLLTALFKAFDNSDAGENDYLMKAVMRVCVVAKADSASFVTVLLQKLTSMLAAVQANPRNPMFNHYLFETMAVLIRNICGSHRAHLEEFEAVLMPAFESILGGESAAEFGPYVFQILAQLLALHESVPTLYAQLFPTLLMPAMWEQSGSAHALSALIRGYLCKASFAGSLGADQLQAVLGVFQKLLASRINDRYGTAILRTLVRHCSWQTLAPFFPQILSLLLQRATSSLTPQFGRCLALVLAEFVCCRGVEPLVEALETMQRGLAVKVFGQVWLPHASKVKRKGHRRLLEIALANLVCKSTTMLTPAFQPVWASALQTLLEMLAEPPASDELDEDESEAMLSRLQEHGGYSNAFARLAFAAVPEGEEFPSVDPAALLMGCLADLAKNMPGQVPAMVKQALTSKQLDLLHQMMQQANVTLS